MNEFTTRREKTQAEIFEIERSARMQNSEICAHAVSLRTNLRWLISVVHGHEGAELPVREITKNLEAIEDLLVNSRCDIQGSRTELIDGVMELESIYAEHLHSRQAAKIHPANDPAVRSAVFALTGGRCAYCDVKLEEGTGSTEAFTIEHIVPRDCGGPDNIANYVPACRSCNCSKSTGHVVAFIQRRVNIAAGVKAGLRVVGEERYQ